MLLRFAESFDFFCAFGAFARTVNKHKSCVKLRFAESGHRHFKIFIAFADKACDDIGRESVKRIFSAEFFKNTHKFIYGITAEHFFEHRIASALNWNVGVRTNFGHILQNVDEFLGVKTRMRTHKSDAVNAVNVCDFHK